MARGYHVEATTPPSRVVKVVDSDTGMAIATMQVAEATHPWWAGLFIRHPYTGLYLARVRHRRGQPITNDEIYPTDATGALKEEK